MISTLRNTLLRFLNSKKEVPLLAGLSAGLYPVLFYYNNNYDMVNSWPHLLFFTGCFILLPTLILIAVRKIFTIGALKATGKYVIPFFNVFTFLCLLTICIHAGIHKLKILGAFIIAVVFALTAWKHYKKVILLQLLLAAVVFVKLLPDFYRHINANRSWAQLHPEEQNITLVKKPNIYMIQPDGYVNASELKKGYYNYDNSAFENWLRAQEFQLYENFRSNYYTTLSSNSALFAMKHHYYKNTLHARKDIVGKNNALSILKANGYSTLLLIETEYLIFNRTRLYYDFCNIAPLEMPFLGTGVALRKELTKDLGSAINSPLASPRFFFIEHMYPTHITISDNTSKGIEGERQAYFKRLQHANTTLKAMIREIVSTDPGAIIIILADHGGGVGMRSTSENTVKTQDRDKIYSMFSAQLAIKWPKDYNHTLDDELVSSVNFFRVLFSYLSDSTQLLDHKEEDKSYIPLNKGTSPGVYEYIAADGSIQCKKVE